MVDKRYLHYAKVLGSFNDLKQTGKVSKIVGLTIESIGPAANVGDLCTIRTNANAQIYGEVVGFRDRALLIMPFSELVGIGPGSFVTSLGRPLQVGVGPKLLGRILDGLGNPIDELGPLKFKEHRSVVNTPIEPLQRQVIRDPLSVGVRAIDGLLTCGRGQRLGIFAGSGVGKSTLLGMMARNTDADINVIALIGERGREVREFLEHDLGPEGLKRSVVVVATSDQPALVRLRGAMTATTIAEYFRDQGKDVLFMMDSVTRVAAAQRQIGLAVGEPPATRGYPPSVFAVLPNLLERTGPGKVGTITAFYNVLVEGDDFNEPITDAVRSIVDGHIILTRKLAESQHYPAIDVLASVSRVMPLVADKKHQELAALFKSRLAAYYEGEDLINIGAYASGSNPRIDDSLLYIDKMIDFLRQPSNLGSSLDDAISLLETYMES